MLFCLTHAEQSNHLSHSLRVESRIPALVHIFENQAPPIINTESRSLDSPQAGLMLVRMHHPFLVTGNNLLYPVAYAHRDPI